jgi:hypothetical protein
MIKMMLVKQKLEDLELLLVIIQMIMMILKIKSKNLVVNKELILLEENVFHVQMEQLGMEKTVLKK